MFTQEIGNIPPGEEIIAEVIVDQRLRWLDEGAWEWRFPTVVAPRYLGEPGRVPDAARISQDVADGPLPARLGVRLDGTRVGTATFEPLAQLQSVTMPFAPSTETGRMEIALVDESGALREGSGGLVFTAIQLFD